jgi:prepilin-type N-terminal cleavage/methylation domain-containing protein/prepilin-type processing-associated H-X9-DG protein
MRNFGEARRIDLQVGLGPSGRTGSRNTLLKAALNYARRCPLVRITANERDAFTLVELLVVIAIIAILAGLLVPAISRGKEEGRKAACISNFRQLHLAWQLYVDDNNGQMPFNQSAVSITDVPGDYNWVAGWMSPRFEPDVTWKDNTNAPLLLKGPGTISSYLNDPKIFKCPSDRSVAEIKGVLYPRVRSVAMNSYMGMNYSLFPSGDPTSWHYQTVDQVLAHIPREMGSVFIDTHEDSIASGLFLVGRPFFEGWDQVPASHHNGGATISFTDGHILCRRWIDARTRQPMTGHTLYGIKQPGNPDTRWMEECATLAKPGGLIYN